MSIKKLLATGSVAMVLLSVGGAAIASAHASTPAAPAAERESSEAVDTDNFQEEVGDQSAKDDKTEADEAEGKESKEADGPGGHEDPAGNVENEAEGNN